jgi:hypothetical protein
MIYSYHYQESADQTDLLTPDMPCNSPADLPMPGDVVQLPGATRPRRVERREFAYNSGLSRCTVAICLELEMMA